MAYVNNITLSPKAEKLAEKLIREAKKKQRRFGGIFCKSNIKLNDNLELIKESDNQTKKNN